MAWPWHDHCTLKSTYPVSLAARTLQFRARALFCMHTGMTCLRRLCTRALNTPVHHATSARNPRRVSTHSTGFQSHAVKKIFKPHSNLLPPYTHISVMSTTVKTANWRLVELGRVVLVDNSKLATIVEIIDQKRVCNMWRPARISAYSSTIRGPKSPWDFWSCILFKPKTNVREHDIQKRFSFAIHFEPYFIPAHIHVKPTHLRVYSHLFAPRPFYQNTFFHQRSHVKTTQPNDLFVFDMHFRRLIFNAP